MILEGAGEVALVREYQQMKQEADRLREEYQKKFSANIEISLSGDTAAMEKSDEELARAHKAYQLAEIGRNNAMSLVAARVLEALDQDKCIEKERGYI